MALSLSKVYSDFVVANRASRFDEPSTVVWEAMRLALSPFRPRNISLYVSEPLAPGGRRFYAEFGTCDFLNFDVYVPDSVIALAAYDPDQFYSAFAERVYDRLINRPRVDPEANIILGDN